MKRAIESKSYQETLDLGTQIGTRLKGGEVFELMSDLGGGKTAFVRGLAAGFGSPDPVASPTFTVSLVYERSDGKELHHFDFYRLEDAGIMQHEVSEVASEVSSVVAVEWGEVVRSVLPKNTIKVYIKRSGENSREFVFEYPHSQEYLFSEVEL